MTSLVVLLPCLAFKPAAAQTTKTIAWFPSLNFEMVLNDGGDLSKVSFQSEMDRVTLDHLNQLVPGLLPSDGLIASERLHEIKLSSVAVYVPESRSNGKESEIKLTYTGNMTFAVPTVLEIDQFNKAVSDLRDQIVNILRSAFQGEMALAFSNEIVLHPLLGVVTELSTFLGAGLIETMTITSDQNEDPPEGTPASRGPIQTQAATSGVHVLAVALAVVFVAFAVAVTLIVGYVYFLRRERWRKALRRARQRQADERSLDGIHNDGDEPPPSNLDAWLDEWAMRITSIPLSHPWIGSAPKKPSTRHPAQQHGRSRGVLWCISEEDDAIESPQSQEADVEKQFSHDSADMDDIDLDDHVPRPAFKDMIIEEDAEDEDDEQVVEPLDEDAVMDSNLVFL